MMRPAQRMWVRRSRIVDPPHELYFKPNGEVIITELGSEDQYIFNAYYEQKGNEILIDGEKFDLTAKFNDNKFFVERINRKEVISLEY